MTRVQFLFLNGQVTVLSQGDDLSKGRNIVFIDHISPLLLREGASTQRGNFM